MYRFHDADSTTTLKRQARMKSTGVLEKGNVKEKSFLSEQTSLGAFSLASAFVGRAVRRGAPLRSATFGKKP